MPPSQHSQRLVAVLLVIAAAAVVIWGDNWQRGTWIPIDRQRHPLGVDELLALPLVLAPAAAVAAIPRRMSATRRAPLVAISVGFAIFVFLGY